MGDKLTDLLRCPEISYLPEQAIGTCRLNERPCFKETHPGALCGYYDDWLKDCQAERRLVCSIKYSGEIVPATFRSGRGSIYRTPEYKAFRETIAYLYKAGYDDECQSDRLYGVQADFFLQDMGERTKWRRGDLDNLIKPFLDSATGIVWGDDNQVVELNAKLHRDCAESGAILAIYDVGFWHQYRTQLKCDYCGKQFSVNRARAERAKTHFCSAVCQYAYRRKKSKCKYCGKEFTYVLSAIRGTKFCSTKCYWQHMREHPGEYSQPAMNKGRPKGRKNQIPHKTLQTLMERSRGLCEECKQPPDWRGLAPHHIKFRSQMGTHTLDNLLMLCGKCHSAKHGIKEV